jgi:peptide subunit release factor 1 (eRF1)
MELTMDALERDYHSVLLAEHEPPCVSLYQPTHRAHPEKQQDPIRFRNLVRDLEASLKQKYAGEDSAPILRSFYDLAENAGFWNHALDGVAVFATSDLFKVYRLQRPVRELTVAASSFHTKPLMRILQSADRYHVLGLNRHDATLYEGNRYALDEVELPSGFPRTIVDVVGAQVDDPERKSRVYGPAGAGPSTRHGTDVRQDEVDNETQRFFRAVDEAVLINYSRPSGLPLLLAALPEHHHLFRTVSHNPALMAGAIDAYPSTLSGEQLRERASALMLPLYLERLRALVERFEEANAKGLGGSDLSDIARASRDGRIATLLIEADRIIPGRFDRASGAIAFAPLDVPETGDLLDDFGENALKAGGEVIIVPPERMPTNTGIAAIYRF